MERNYRIYFKFSVKNTYDKTVWFKTILQATNFIDTLVEKVEFMPEHMRIKIEERIK